MDACVRMTGSALWCCGAYKFITELFMRWMCSPWNGCILFGILAGKLGVLACFRVACWLLCQRAITRAFVDGMVHEALRSLGNDVTVRKSALRSMSCMITTIWNIDSIMFTRNLGNLTLISPLQIRLCVCVTAGAIWHVKTIIRPVKTIWYSLL